MPPSASSSSSSTPMTKSDYQKILSYYKLPFDKLSSHELKQQAETILATKLCKCIKSVPGANNTIALCSASVFGKKGLKFYDMSCKGKARLLPRKGSSQRLAKTRKLAGHK
jgi:hypothetical protein